VILSVVSGNGLRITSVLSSRTTPADSRIGLTISSLSVQIAGPPAFDLSAS
jgi:hypothetical protein